LGELLHGVEFLLGGGEGSLQPGNLTEPAFAFGFGEASLEIVASTSRGILSGSGRRSGQRTQL
jgi:hypothetical protein